MKKFSCEWGNLAYRIEGEGKENYLIVHDARGGHHLVKHTFAYFSTKGKTLTVDLRGHGKSDAPKTEYTVEYYLSIVCAERRDFNQSWKHLQEVERMTRARNHHPMALKGLLNNS